jgi:hypothetical protein
MKSLLMAMVAGSCAAALGQELTPMGAGRLGPIYRIDAQGNIVGEGSPYDSRTVGITYQNDIFRSQYTNGVYYWSPLGAGNRHLLEDVSFTPGPWQNITTVYSISRVSFSLYHVSTTQAPASVQYKFYAAASCNFSNNPMIAAGATPVLTWTVPLPATGFAADTGYGFTPVNFTPVTIPAGNYFVEAKIINPATGQDLGSDIWRLCACTNRFASGNPCLVGSTGASLGDDLNNNGAFEGGVVTTTENRIWGFTVGGQYWNIGLDLTLGGDIPAAPPACTPLTLGADNVFVADAGAYTGAQVKWYCLALSGAADDTALKYVDLDTEGSAVDAAIGIYGAGGVLIAKDEGSGSGTNAQLSFGIGRRAGVGDGVQYDGRNWDTTATTSVGLGAGTYYVAVATSGSGAGATFADGFSVTGSGTAGNITLRVRTNAGGGTLQQSVAPICTRVSGTGGVDPVVAPGGASTGTMLTGPGVLWYDVNLCHGADAGNVVTLAGTGTTALAYSITVFDGAGNKVGQATGTNTVAAAAVFGGSGPALAAGHYYAAMTYDDSPDLAPNAATAGRWHVRGRNPSQGYNFVLAVAVPWSNCQPPCGSADFDCDGDVATDFDIQAFFACLGGNCPAPPCTSSSDFNGDGDAGTDADIEAFFRVLAGGPC